MTQIVCNSGPLIALERVEQLALLQAVLGQVLIPTAVEQEFLAGQPSFVYAWSSITDTRSTVHEALVC